MEPAVRIRWEPEEVVPGLFRLPLPYAYGSSVNVLLLPGPEGALLVDAGYASDEGRAIFDAGLATLGLARSDIRAVLVTHADVDHIGLVADLERGGARILVHERERERGPLWHGSAAWLAANGYDGPPPRARIEEPRLPDRVETVADGQVLPWAGFELRLIHCPGHTPGLLCAFDAGRRLLLSTDHVLRAETPVGLFGAEGDPVGDYLASVDRLRGLDATLVVPGHGRAFSGLDERLAAIRHGVEGQLDDLEGQLGDVPLTAWQITGRRDPEADPRRRLRAIFFVLAGLRHLERRGRAVAIPADGVISYRAA